MFWAVDVSSNCIERNTPYKSCIERDVVSEKWYWTRMFLKKRDLESKQFWIYAYLLMTAGPVGPRGGIYSTIEDNCQKKTVRAMKKLWDLTVVHTGYSCYLSSARSRQGQFFLLLDLGLGATACGMGIEINTDFFAYHGFLLNSTRSTQSLLDWSSRMRII